MNLIEKLMNTLFKADDHHEFKPILSEIEESPVSPMGRFLFWVVIALIAFIVL